MESLIPIGISEFVQMSDIDAVRLFGTVFPKELSHLKNAHVTVESTTATALGRLGENENETPSNVLYKEDFPEVNRTLVSMLAIKWVIGNEYTSFTVTQKTNKLSERSFQRLRDFYNDRIRTTADLHALLIAMVIDDIGKDPKLSEEMAQLGVDASYTDHSDLVYKAAQAKLIPSLNIIPASSQHDVLDCLHIGSKLNISQAVQGECPPASLEILSNLQGKGNGVNLRAMVTFLDVAGAGGHADTRSCIVMGEPVFQAYMSALDSFDRFSKGTLLSPRACYDHILDTRAENLRQLGFEFPADANGARALSRLLCMGRVTTKEQAYQFNQALDQLSPSAKKDLVNGLNVDGIDDGVAIVPYYAPGLIADALKGTDKTDAVVIPVLSAFFRFLAKVFDGSSTQTGVAGGMIERDLSFVQDTIKSSNFRNDPTTLDNVSIPWK
ncbi:hypothetical protein N7481_012062 [Penicillium waksmanii]|uniref:uncharacterized protein n=1 Tax=Penicillium waksmanii TaxID=69791 RepID=UPI0025494603|nr:uncharacterized protein N7481_012062 [Penicillium waksmanii]KAJ5965348.1 hypothetical protein N7481_012062 [Penicillium waksmanii]